MPFQHIKVCHWFVAVDREATAQAYQHPYLACDCAYCRNFLEAQAYVPKGVYYTLQLLGIDPLKPAEIVEYCQHADGSHLYSWWYHAVGQILAEPDDTDSGPADVDCSSGFEVRLTSKTDLAQAHIPQPIIQIEFFSSLPWVLEERPAAAS